MTTSPPQESSPRGVAVVSTIAPVVVLVSFFLYIRLCIDPVLLYEREGPAFVTTFEFFRSFLDRPGGVVAYVSAFLMQSYPRPWLGAAVITVVAGGICLLTRGVVGAMTDRRIHPSVYFIPAVLLLMAHGQYRHLLTTSLALLAALALANLYVRIALGRFAVRLVGFLVLSAVLYYAAGGMVVLFGAVCGAFELLKGRRVVLAVLCVLFTAALPLAVAAYSYRIDLSEACVSLLPFRGGIVLLASRAFSLQAAFHAALLLFFPAAMVLSSLGTGLSGVVSFLRRRVAPTAPGVAAEPHGAWTAVSLGVFVLLGALLTFLSFDGNARARLRIDYHADHGDWEAVLESARRLSAEWYDIYVVHDVNRALHHAGRFPDEMFFYPQKGLHGAVTPDWGGLLAYRKVAQFFLELGHVNAAQHWGHIAIETKGESPPLLRLLVKVSLLKGRTRLARTYLHALAKHLLWRTWAKEQMRRLDEDPAMPGDAELEHLRTVMLKEDFRYGGFGGFTYDQILSQPLRTNRRNRMAFEYLMAYYLLSKRPDMVVANLRRLEDFDYVGIPRHYEEAVLVYRRTQPGAARDLHGRQVSPESVERFRGFMRDVLVHQESSGAEQEAAYRTLAERWGNTYFFYFTFGFSEPRPGWRITRPMEPAGAEQ